MVSVKASVVLILGAKHKPAGSGQVTAGSEPQGQSECQLPRRSVACAGSFYPGLSKV